MKQVQILYDVCLEYLMVKLTRLRSVSVMFFQIKSKKNKKKLQKLAGKPQSKQIALNLRADVTDTITQVNSQCVTSIFIRHFTVQE